MSYVSHQNNFGTNLTTTQIAGVTSTPLNEIPSVAAPFYIALDATNLNSKYEVVLVTSKTATHINHAATTYAHTTAEEVRMVIPAAEMDVLGTSPQGYMYNGKLSVTDADGITVAVKTLAGTDPSVADPVWVRIGDTMRAITAALSVAKADGTNWCNAGSAELATKEIDYFVYLGYNATDGVTIGFSRYPGANSYDDFSTTTTNEKYCAISTITNAAATDYYEVIGRFAATLSAGAGYTWSVPTFTAKNLIQRPIYETRWLTFAPVAVGWASYSSDWAKYKVMGSNLIIKWSATTSTSNSTTTSITLPFVMLNYPSGPSGAAVNNSAAVGPAKYSGTPASNVLAFYLTYANAVWTASGTKGVALDCVTFEI